MQVLYVYLKLIFQWDKFYLVHHKKIANRPVFSYFHNELVWAQVENFKRVSRRILYYFHIIVRFQNRIAFSSSFTRKLDNGLDKILCTGLSEGKNIYM